MAELDVGKLSLTIEADGRAAIFELNRVKEAAEGASTDAVRAYQSAGDDMADAFEPAAEAAEETAEAVRKMGEEAEKSGDAVQAAGQKATRSFNDMIESADRFGTTMTAGVTAPLIALYGTMVKGASDLTETIGKTEVVFGAFSDDVMTWSEGAVKSMGLAQSTALDMASTFGDMAVGMGLNQAAAKDMSTSLTQLAADLASFKNISADRAAEALTGVYTGETEALKSLGVVMTQANLQAYAYSQGITAQVSAMSQAEQVQLRYQYVMAQTANAQGDFVRTGGNLANQSRALVQTLKQAGNSFGNVLTPAVTEAVSQLREGAQWLAELDDGTKTAILSIGGVTAAIGPLVLAGTKVVKLVTTLRTAMSAVSLGPVAIGVAAITAAVIGLYSALDRANSKIDTTSQKYQSLKRSLSGGTLVEITANAEELDALDGRNIEVTYTVGQSADSDQAAWDAFVEKVNNMGWENKSFTATGEFEIEPGTVEQIDVYATAMAEAATATENYDKAVEGLNSLLEQQLQAQMQQIDAQVFQQGKELAIIHGEGYITDEEYQSEMEKLTASATEAKEALQADSEAAKEFFQIWNDGTAANDAGALGVAFDEMFGEMGVSEEMYGKAYTVLTNAKDAGEDMSKYQIEAMIINDRLREQSIANYQAMIEAQQAYDAAIAAANATQQETVEANQNVMDNASLMARALDAYGEGLMLFDDNAEQAISFAADQLATNAEEFEAIRQQLSEQLTNDETGELMTRNYGEVYDTFTTMAAEAETAIEQALTDGETARATAAETFATTLNDLTGDFTAAETQMILEMAASTGVAISEADAEMFALVESMLDQLATAAKNGSSEMLDTVSEMIANVGDESANAEDEGAEVGAAITAGITRGLNSGTGALYSTIRSIANNTVAEFKRTLEIKSPSRRSARELGIPFIQGISVGAEEETPNMVKTIRQSVEHMVTGATQVVNRGSITVPALAVSGTQIDYAKMGEAMTDAVSAIRIGIDMDGKEVARNMREDTARQQAIRAREINIGKGRIG